LTPVQRFTIEEASQVAEARRQGRALAVKYDLDDAAAERVAIVITEAATNLLKHAGGGVLLLSASQVGDQWAIDVLALDRGPGMSPAACRVDGFSTTGTLGTGLGAIIRMSRRYDFYSQPSAGTAVFAQISKNGYAVDGRAADEYPRVHGIQMCKPGEEVCGDQWEIRERRDGRTIVVADGLGHGSDACAAARAAVDVLGRTDEEMAPRELVVRMHESMRHTRGAAVAVAVLDERRRLIHFCGLGNISGRVFEGGAPARSMVSISGTAGVEARIVREFTYPWPAGAAVVFHSDGLSARWDLSDYPGLLTRDEALIAGVLIRDQYRHTDDVTVVVVK
jgi:anti-sigma regulatory factor (Ser/Thr protein kinase)